MRVGTFIVSFMAVLFLIGSGVASAYDIVINEIMVDPTTPYDRGEWFELYNTTDSEINLNGWVIKDDGTNSHTITGDLEIAPHGFLVLAKKEDSSENGGLPVVDYVYSNFALNNGEDEIILVYGATEIDRVNYTSAWPWSSGHSMALLDPGLDNNLASNWYEESTFTYGLGDYGTPGMANVPIPGTLLLLSSGLAGVVAWRKRPGQKGGI